MDNVLVLQSFRPFGQDSWYARCQASVQHWCQARGYAYQFAGDEFFDRLPQAYANKVASRRPIAADLARLLWIQEALDRGVAEIVAWLDMDSYIFAPQHFQIAPHSKCIFGYEHWLQKRPNKAGYGLHKNVHNAYCAFRRDDTALPFLIDSIQAMVARVDLDYLAPQFVGPKLLTSLHNIVGFELDKSAGAISPDLMNALLNADQRLVQRLRLSEPMACANLCGSLHPEDDPQVFALLDVLDGFRSGLI